MAVILASLYVEVRSRIKPAEYGIDKCQRARHYERRNVSRTLCTNDELNIDYAMPSSSVFFIFVFFVRDLHQLLNADSQRRGDKQKSSALDVICHHAASDAGCSSTSPRFMSTCLSYHVTDARMQLSLQPDRPLVTCYFRRTTITGPPAELNGGLREES